MLDSNFNAKLGDFGLARLVHHEEQVETTVVAGTRSYMAPECLITEKASKESDVYSFGVVALEIACGRRPIEPNAQQNEVKMVDWVWELYGNGKILKAVDPRLGVEYDEKIMECLMVVGLWCANPDWVHRPSIRQAILVLNFEVPLPVLPEKMPMPTSFGPQGNSFGSYANSSFYASGGSSQVQSSSYSGNSNNSVAKSLPSHPSPAAVSFSSPHGITT
ncbi:L-type lectin-domain containing receptor kinase IX.1-like [Rhododendron vialii]|uniref:L-type lectin-domain containing receptor kinase IX.1-like n=1 Tax=Rhododendron vialii TaxID=182163 RepID=UPI00265F197E|nr:L-type lectin-domain containing receptor kinase IX.1-like [Rhododendron vialii]